MGAASISVEDLVALVESEPRRALDESHARLAETSLADGVAAQLWWVAGLAQRELGDLATARTDLERAFELAGSAGDPSLAARVTISLAFEIGHGGDIPGALQMLDAAEGHISGADLALLSIQRGILHYRLGHLEAAVADLTSSHELAAQAGDRLTDLKALVNLGAIQSQRAEHDDARRWLLTAVTMAADLDQVSWAAVALGNLAYVETSEGNLPEALDAFAAAEDGFRRAGSQAELPRLHADHALALADANLLDDAEQLIDRAVELSAASGNDLEVAELLLVSAEIDLAKGKPDEAAVSAREAGGSFARQGRDSWLHVAERLRLRADARLDPHDPAVADGLVENAGALEAGGWRSEALAAVLLAALLHAQSGREQQATALVAIAGPQASRGRATDRILLGHVLALLAEQQGRRAAARRAVTAGLRVAAAAQAALGSLETRSHAAQHGAELIEIGVRLAVADGRPRELLHRIEAMRTMMWHAPLVRPPDDEAMAAQLTELRRLNTLVADPESAADARRAAEDERLRVERTIRGLARRARGDRSTGRGAFTTTEQAVADAIADLSALGDHQLLSFANLDGELLAVSADRGRTRLHRRGAVAALGEHLEACSFALHRLNRVQGSDASRDAAGRMLDEATEALAAQVLPPNVVRSDRPLVVVPTGALYGVPWTALHALRGRAVAVSPSMSAWSVAARGAASRVASRFADGTSTRRDQPAGFVAGPALRFSESEVVTLARSYDRAVVLTGAAATADASLDLFGRSEMVHLACHGSFRSDNPLFSTLSLVDGPLTVYDLERVARMPEVVVLSACSVATSAAINGGTLLGLSSALGAFGASDVVAPLTPVNDERVTAVMRRFHDGLASGQAPSVALAGAARPDGGPLDPVAAAFVVIGA